MHIEFMLEEASAEAFLSVFLPRVLPAGWTWRLIAFQGKSDLLGKLGSRLRAYSHWIPEDYRIVVLVDEDRQDCLKLKERLERDAIEAGFTTKSHAVNGAFRVLNRIAVEELEAWYFSDPLGLSQAFPGVPSSLGQRAKYRDPDAIAGGTWEAFERVLQTAGYYKGGLPKIEVARHVAATIAATGGQSASFRCFVQGLAEIA